MIRVFPNQIVLQINVKKKEAKMLALPLLLKGQFLHYLVTRQKLLIKSALLNTQKRVAIALKTFHVRLHRKRL